jgi:GTPase SAR1 family protein
MPKIDKEMESSLVRLVNQDLFEREVYLAEYQKVDFYVYSENIVTDILHDCKFIDVGNVYDFPDILPQPEFIDGFDLSINFKLFQRIAVSKKLNSIALYTIERHGIHCTFLIDSENLQKFAKITKDILQQDSRANLFREIDFQCKNREYIEVSDATGDTMKPADVLKKKVAKEQLVFDKDSTIVEVMTDIKTFFKEETHKMYDRMQIAYKRGIIIYGDPGNGKSAMIREIIRSIPTIAKIVINPNVVNVTKILSSLTKSLNGKPAIIIIEDIDSLITSRNRSEFLNILDGVDIKSGVFFIGSTNYPDKIDPAFMNRSGRFDRTYKIDNPSENTRRVFFQSRNIGDLLSEYKVHRDENIPDTNEGTVELFVKHSHDLPMASLKEIMTSTQYLLASNEEMSIEEAVEKTYIILSSSKKEHVDAHASFKKKKSMRLNEVNQDDYDE